MVKSNAGDTSLIPAFEISPGEGNHNPLHWEVLWTEEPVGYSPQAVKSQTQLSN